MRSSKPLQEFSVAAHSEGKSLLDALTKFVYQHRQEIKASHLGTEASNLLQGMKDLVSGFEQLATTEAQSMKVSTLHRLIREEVRRAVTEAQDMHRDGDVWYEKSRGGYTPTHGEGTPWGARYDGKVLYFLTQKAASRYADQGSGKLVDDVSEAMTTVDLSKQAGMGASQARGYKQQCVQCDSTGTVVTYSADSALAQLKKDGWTLSAGGSLCPRCAKSAVTTPKNN